MTKETTLNPQIEFRHVLSELSVNRNDPCEVLRELISNSYDAGAMHIYYVPIKDQRGLGFLDDGTGLDPVNEIKGITPWAAFFSIGKSTKNRGDGIGYKCQGSKLCFACSRILVATTSGSPAGEWKYKLIDNPRSNLDVSLDITPAKTSDLPALLDSFFATPSADTANALSHLKAKATALPKSGTLILIDHLDTEDFGKYFAIGSTPDECYVYNYIRFYSRHGDARWRLLQLRVVHHPAYWMAGVMALLIYANFFTHHYIGDYRWYIAACALGLYARSTVIFRPLDRDRKMPLLLSFVLIGFFIWLAENISTFFGIWKYPNQLGAWSSVHVGKWSSWSLLIVMTFTIVANLKHVKERIHVPA